jgi:hypothetical protein
MGLSTERVRSEYLQAYQARPSRAEPLYELARYHRKRQEYALAQLFAQKATEIPISGDIFFVDASVYQWRAWDEVAVAASYCFGQTEVGRQAMRRLLQEQLFPEQERSRIEANKRFFGL